MRTRFETSTSRFLLVTAVALLISACGQQPSAESTTGAPPLAEGTQELPPDHPPLTTPPAETLIAPPPAGSGTGTTGLTWQVPDGWTEEQPSSAMRRAQYRVPGPGGDGECAVFYFGPGQGGDAMANAVRWANQFSQPDGRSSQEAMTTETIDIAGVPVLLAEVSGTYSGGTTMMGGPSEELTDHMLLGAIAQGGDANWFFKLTGPAATLDSQRDPFRSMIESLTRGG